MRYSLIALTALAEVASIAGQSLPKPDANGKYTISAPGIRAQFIAYGASLTNLFVNGTKGETDIVLGLDSSAAYPLDKGHPVYNSVPGRYVARIKNGVYTLDGVTYHTEQNDGNNTLHSGTNNWSYRTWDLAAITGSSITFSVTDKSNSSMGMPGDVMANVTYSLTNSTWHIKMSAVSPQHKTPLMLTQHTYFNLDAFKAPSPKIWNHTLYMPYSPRYLENSDDAVPTGKILMAKPGSVNDFSSKPDMQLGHATSDPAFPANCGGGGQCEGYNGFWLIEGAPKDAVVLKLASPFSGIKGELRTDQPGVVVYTCNWMDGSEPMKSTQGTSANTKVIRSSCVAIEAQDYPDGINHPEWNRTDAEITGPGKTYSWESSWTFGTL